MTKSTYFLPVKTTYSVEDYAKLCLQEVVRFHGVPVSTISKAKLSTSFHPNIDGQAESTIHTLEYMLRSCMIYFKGNGENRIPLIEFAYYKSYDSRIQMAPYEALYWRRYKSPIGWFKVGEAGLTEPHLFH